MKRVLLIEDDQEIAGIIFDFLELKGIELDYANNGLQGLELALVGNFDLIILDLILPRLDGFSVCSALREQGNQTPVLVLTASRNKKDMLKGFAHGADDYLTKPFDLDILQGRIEALIRRYRGSVAQTQLSYGPVVIEQKNRRAFRDSRPLVLTPTTFTILELLVQRAPDIVTRQEVAQKLWGENESNPEVLRSHIYQLRNQLDKPFVQPILTTVPKVGFRLEIPSSS